MPSVRSDLKNRSTRRKKNLQEVESEDISFNLVDWPMKISVKKISMS